jgi:hypothetical protein
MFLHASGVLITVFPGTAAGGGRAAHRVRAHAVCAVVFHSQHVLCRLQQARNTHRHTHARGHPPPQNTHTQVGGPVLRGLSGMSSLLLESEDAGFLLQVCCQTRVRACAGVLMSACACACACACAW